MKDLSCFEVFHTFEDGDNRDMHGELKLLDVLNERLSQYRKQYDQLHAMWQDDVHEALKIKAELSALKAEIEGGLKVYGRRVPTGERVRWTEYSRPEDSYEALLIRMKPIGEK